MSSNHVDEVFNLGSGSNPISNGYEIVPYDNKRVRMGMGIPVPGQSKAVAAGAGGVDARKNDTLGSLQGVRKSMAVKDTSGASVHRYGSLPQLTTGDDECRKKFLYSTNIVSNQDWENPFAMNSSVAFGANDWDDFVQESGDIVGVPLIWDRLHEQTEPNLGSQRNLFSVPHETPVESVELEKNRTDYVSEAGQQIQNGRKVGQNSQKDVRDAVLDESEEYLNSCSITNVFETDGASVEKPQLLEMKAGIGTKEYSNEANYPPLESEELSGFNNRKCLENRELESCDANSGSVSGSSLTYHSRIPLKIDTELSEDDFPHFLAFDLLETEVRSESKSILLSEAVDKDNTSSIKSDTVEPNEFIADVLHEMEEILLDSAESPGPRATDKRPSNFEEPGLTASTSGLDDGGSIIRNAMKIDGVEVIGAKQKKGNVSLSERLVGVKEHTVYIIRVWIDNDHWEVERRYRDFITLYHRLKSFFGDQGLDLPSEWSSIEAESSKIFGSASPDVVAERSRLIEDCLRSILHFKPPDALLLFLSPRDFVFAEKVSTLGKTIALIVENRPYMSMKQLLETQHHCCAGCRSHFDDTRNFVRDFVQKFGWGKPRLCEYTGQLFCSSCHTNETAVLPARVLHSWDFTEYLVCQLAKSYLDSIHDKPVLCVSAVNPLLFAKVPGLFHVMGTRKKIGSMLPFVRCPFRISIDKGLGSRKYLIESSDFFALRDLIDLSKGAFAALPTMLETVSRKILEHITEECLICCDVGTPCGAKQACRDPSSLMFPFQEDEIYKCGSCNAVFHRQCFKRVAKCNCQLELDTHEIVDSSVARRPAGSTLLSRLFSKVKSDKTKDPIMNESVLLMGSLPSNSIDNL